MSRDTNKKETMVVGADPEGNLLEHFLAVLPSGSKESGIVTLPRDFRGVDFIVTILRESRIGIASRRLNEETVAVEGTPERIEEVRRALAGLGLMEIEGDDSAEQSATKDVSTTRDDLQAIDEGLHEGAATESGQAA